MINDLLCRPNLLLAIFLLYIAYCYHSISYKQKTVTNKRLKPSTLLQLQHLAVTYYVTTIFKNFIFLNDLILHKIMFHQVAKPSLKERNSVIALETAAKYYLKVSFPVEMSLRRAARWLFFFSICACCRLLAARFRLEQRAREMWEWISYPHTAAAAFGTFTPAFLARFNVVLMNFLSASPRYHGGTIRLACRSKFQPSIASTTKEILVGIRRRCCCHGTLRMRMFASFRFNAFHIVCGRHKPTTVPIKIRLGV